VEVGRFAGPGRGEAGICTRPERRVGRERDEEGYLVGERRDGPDRALLVRDRDVQPVDGLHPRGPAHLLVHPAVAFLGGDLLRCRLREGVGARRREPRLAALDEVLYPPAQGGELLRQLCYRAICWGADLHTRGGELGGHGTLGEPGGIPGGEDSLYRGDERERRRIHELKLFLDTDGVRRRSAEVGLHAATLTARQRLLDARRFRT